MARSFRSASILLLLALSTVLLITGCGGGGGGGGDSSTANFVITGRVQDFGTGSGIAGATVLIGGQSDTTDSSGNYRIEFETAPAASNWTVAAPDTYYSYWAMMGQTTTPVNPENLPMPSVTSKSTTMPVVKLLGIDLNPPPFPVD